MWEKETMSLLESLIYSGMGLLVVLGVLACLALLVVIFSKILKLWRHDSEENSSLKQTQKESSSEEEEETAAVILAVIAEETGLDPGQVQVTSIQEVQDAGSRD